MEYVSKRISTIRSSISDGREELVHESRRKIANAATRLFKKNGFHKTAIRDVAVEMGVSQGHIYQYISRKEDILLLMLSIAVDDYNEKLFGILDEDTRPTTKLTHAIDAYYRIIDRHRDKTTVLYNHTSSLSAQDRKIFDLVELDVTHFFEAILTEGIEAGDFAKVDTFMLAFDIVSLGHMWALKHHRFKGRQSLESYIETQIAVMQSALSAS